MADPNKSRMPSGTNGLEGDLGFLQEVAHYSPNILFVIDLEEQKVLYVNKKAEELTGYDPDYIISRGPEIFNIIMHPDDYEGRMGNLEKCRDLLDGEECAVEVRLRTGVNKWEWVKITEKPFRRNEEGEVTQVLGIAVNIHEQKLAEKKLQEEHRRLENAQKIGHIGSFERKLPGEVMHCSEEFFRILGIEPRKEGITVNEFFSFVHPEDREALQSAVEKTHATGEPVDTITRLIRPDNSIKYIHRRAGIIEDEQGLPVMVYGTMQDITERVRAEEERKKAESLMRSTETLAGMGSYEVDPRTNILYFSDGLFRIFGEEPRAFIPSFKWIEEHSHPDDIPVVQEIIDRALTNRTSFTYTQRIFRSDGRQRVLEVNGRLLTNPRGEIDKVVGLVQDISQRKEAEEELRKSEKRRQNLLEVLQNAPDAYLILSSDYYIQMASDAYLSFTGAVWEALAGKYIFDVFPDNPANPDANGVANLRASLKKVLESKEPHRMTIQHYDVRNDDGKFIEKYWSPTNTPVINSEGEVEYIIHRVLDMTDVVKEQAAAKRKLSETEMLKTSLEEIKLQAQQLRENRSLLQSVFDASPNSIVLYKTLFDKGRAEDFEFFMVNAHSHSSLKLPPDINGKQLSNTFPYEKNPRILSEFKKTAETGEPADFEIWIDEKGYKNWFHFQATKLNDLLVVTAVDITERKKAERELIQLKEALAQKATDKYRKIINSMDEGFCIIEVIRDAIGVCVDYRYLEVNPVFEVQTGLENALGKTMNELVPDIENNWKKIYGNVASTGESVRFEDYAEALGRWFDVNAFRIDSPNEQHVAVLFKDITERKEAEERKSFLLELNDAIRPLEDPSKIKETAMRILGVHLEVNRAYYAEVLTDEDTLAGRQGYVKGLDPLTYKTKISEFNPDFQKHFQEGKTLVVEDILKGFDHSEKAKLLLKSSRVRAFIAVPLMKGGKLVAVVAVQQKNPRRWNPQEVALVEEACEQTWAAMEKAMAEKGLRESEQRFRNLVEASALAVWEMEPDGSVSEDSISWRNFTGQTFEEWIGNGWANAIHKEDRGKAVTELEYAIKNQTKLDSEFRLMSAGGDSRWTSVKATPILDIEGKVAKWAGMNIDIHDRKQAEEALILAKEEAEAASRAKEDFLSTMSHEIRTPLNAVIGLTNLLLDKAPREDQKENLNSLSFSAKNLLALINDILDFSKLEAGKAELTVTDFDLHGLLINLQQSHLPLAQNRQTKLELNIDKKIPHHIAADQLKLSQVLHNLVSNAVKFTSQGKVSINVDLEQQEQETLWLRFEVKDTGIGIPKEKLDSIFEKFTQAESSTVRQYGGTGLGLSITRLLLELMGSEIKLNSTPGEGSSFYFSLPVKKAQNGAAAVALPGKLEQMTELGDLKVLLVEDVDINRKIIIQFFENWWKIEPDEARNGKEAVEMAKKNQYDLILMDIRMPVMDGYQATEQIKELPGYEQIPILALTADKNQEVEQAIHDTKFSGLLTKPFEPLDLKKKILLHLPGSSNLTEEGEQHTDSSSSEDPAEKYGEHREELLPIILQQLKEYRNSFSSAVNEDDLKKLNDLQHKSQVLFQMLHLIELSTKLEKSIVLLSEDAERTERLQVLEEAKTIFDRTIDHIQEEMEEPVFEISRYNAIAGKNPEVLTKLITHSVRTLESYQLEFTAAARDRDLENLSNLVHKNTTTLHYLQAKRLERKINDFRRLLENPDMTAEDARGKEQEVQREFDLIIRGLQSLDDFY